MANNNHNGEATKPQAPSLAELVIVVTGGTGGIGGAVASAFAKEAHGLVIFARRANDRQSLKHVAGNKNVLAIPGDITSLDSVQAMAGQAVKRFGRVDALINCAGVVPRGHFMATAPQNWQTAIDINLNGYAHLCRAVLPHMIGTGFGRIINLTTRIAANPGPLTSAYASSKAGAHMLMRSLAAEISQQGYHNILINDLVPGPTKSNTSDKGQDPALVVPYMRELVLQPEGSPTGKVYFNGKLYDLFGQQ
jgi:NAD(P)-dependent dehydrogenase (short-subunit alcohol dehydrogenase family)